MPIIAKLIIAIEGLVFVLALGAIIYLIFRRIEKKKSEDFEKRDN
jgi:hypothetical protein